MLKYDRMVLSNFDNLIIYFRHMLGVTTYKGVMNSSFEQHSSALQLPDAIRGVVIQRYRDGGGEPLEIDLVHRFSVSWKMVREVLRKQDFIDSCDLPEHEDRAVGCLYDYLDQFWN